MGTEHGGYRKTAIVAGVIVIGLAAALGWPAWHTRQTRPRVVQTVPLDAQIAPDNGLKNKTKEDEKIPPVQQVEMEPAKVFINQPFQAVIIGTGLSAVASAAVEDHSAMIYDCTIVSRSDTEIVVQIPAIACMSYATLYLNDTEGFDIARGSFYVTTGISLDSATPNPVARGSNITITGHALQYSGDWRILNRDDYVEESSNRPRVVSATSTQVVLNIPADAPVGTFLLATFFPTGDQLANIEITIE